MSVKERRRKNLIVLSEIPRVIERRSTRLEGRTINPSTHLPRPHTCLAHTNTRERQTKARKDACRANVGASDRFPFRPSQLRSTIPPAPFRPRESAA